MTTPDTLTLTRPDDWHLHIRSGQALAAVLPHTARRFGRAIIMPNLVPPVSTVARARDYLEEIKKALPSDANFEPLMTLYLTDNTSAEEIQLAAAQSYIKAVKLYPAGATTNSDAGVTDIRHCYSALEQMQELGLPLLVHGEVTDSNIDVFDREKYFIERRLIPLRRDFPELKIVFEHITTSDAVDYVLGETHQLTGATITAHHLLLNRNAMFSGGIRPHHYCLPVLKRERHREALLRVATSGDPRFFLGTDSAPHAQDKKETACGCAGIFTAHAAIELYATVFEKENALDKLEDFASHFGPAFYKLAHNKDTITLKRETWKVPSDYPFGDQRLIPFMAGETLNWKLND